MSKFAVATAIILLVLMIGCAKDIFLPDPEPIIGFYKGEYVVTEDYKGPDESEKSWPIEWTFTENNGYIWHLDYNIAYYATGLAPICRGDGKYSLDEGVVLVKRHSQPDIGFTACAAGDDPEGVFQLYRRPDGRLELTQLSSLDDGETQTLKRILLRPPLELEKEYFGKYTFAVGAVEKTQPIMWVFTDEKCYLLVDPGALGGWLFDEDWPICKSLGAHSQSGGTITIDNEWYAVDDDAGFTTCVEDESKIDGAFTAVKSDTLILGFSEEKLLTVDLTRTSGDTTWNLFIIELPEGQ